MGGTLEVTDASIEESTAGNGLGHVLNIAAEAIVDNLAERLVIFTRVSMEQQQCLPNTMMQSAFAQLVMREVSFSPDCLGGGGGEFDVQLTPCGGSYTDYNTGSIPVSIGVCSSSKEESCSATPVAGSSLQSLRWSPSSSPLCCSPQASPEVAEAILFLRADSASHLPNAPTLPHLPSAFRLHISLFHD